MNLWRRAAYYMLAAPPIRFGRNEHGILQLQQRELLLRRNSLQHLSPHLLWRDPCSTLQLLPVRHRDLHSESRRQRYLHLLQRQGNLYRQRNRMRHLLLLGTYHISEDN